MALSAGTRIGPYEIQAPLGAGGMGEVYRARDARLARDVALKVLPDSFADDPDRLARFQREAQVLAALKHPNIGAIYGLEETGGVRALVLELIEGDTLAERIARGAIPVDEALAIARQIAEALEAAHEQGIIHRDLKPANIKIAPDGVAKVLDFGLAKLTTDVGRVPPNGPDVGRVPRSGPAGADLLSQSPTLTSPARMTGVGMILGTAAYMAPEQARGKPADKRSDIWSFGCVLFEMLTGKRAFEGEDVGDTLAAVLRGEPDWTTLPNDVPAAIRALVRACLVKDRRERVGDMSGALFVLRHQTTLVAASGSGPTAAALPAQARRRTVAVAGAALLAGAGLTGAVTLLRQPVPPPPAITRFSIMLPEGQTVVGFPLTRRLIALSPDGQSIVYVANNQLLLRRLSEVEARPIAGTESNPINPFFSPDGQWIGFFSALDGTLKKIAVTGGAPLTLCRATNPLDASWDGDTILFGQGGDIFAVAASGGTPERIVEAGPTEVLSGPKPLPGGDVVLFAARTGGAGNWDSAEIVAYSRATRQRKTLVRGGSAARYVAGRLVYAVGANVLAVPFDAAALEILGDPVPVLQGVSRAGVGVSNLPDTANFDVADNGTLVYFPGSGFNTADTTIEWVDRAGRGEPTGIPPRAYAHVRLSPDASRLLLDIRDQESDMWVGDLVRKTLTRLTFGNEIEFNPAWTPDGRRIVFSSSRTPQVNLFWQAADGTGSAEQLFESTVRQDAMSVTPDGTGLLVRQGGDIYLLSLQRERRATALVRTPFAEDNAIASPDGRWMAYQSNESGQNEIYVRPFPNVDGGRWQVSTGGGTRPLWARNGRELFYYVDPGKVMSVPVDASTAFTAGTPAKVVDGPYIASYPQWNYDVTPDGRRFVMIKQPEDDRISVRQIIVVENWTEELNRLVSVP